MFRISEICLNSLNLQIILKIKNMNISKLKYSALSFIIGLSFLCCGQTGGRGKNVNWKEMLRKENTIIVDVRTPDEFVAGRIEKSINIPLSVLPDSVEYLRTFDNIILVCRSGNRSGKAKVLLEKNGLKNVYNGGGWESLDKELKVEK